MKMRTAYIASIAVLLLVASWFALASMQAADTGLPAPQPAVAEAAASQYRLVASDRASANTPVVEDSEARGLLPTSSAPVTFKSHLVDFIKGNFKNDGRVFANLKSSDSVIADKSFNPDGKVLNSEQYGRLTMMVASYNEMHAELSREEGPFCADALIRGVESDQYVAKGQAPLNTTDPMQQALQMKAQTESTQKELRETMAALSLRLGRPMQDWAFSVLSTKPPGEVGYITVVYFTVRQAPELFACRQRMKDLDVEQRRDLRQFFSNLPK